MFYSEKYTVTSHNVDVNDNLRPTMVAQFMQETANHHMRDRKPSYYDLFAVGKSFIVTRMAIETYEQIHQYDNIEVKTWRCPEKAATFIRCFLIERDGKVCARAYTEWAVANRNTGKLCRAGEVDISNYETGEPLEMSIPVRFRFPKDTTWERVGTKRVMYSDVDMNMHMNNTRYLDMLWNYIPEITGRKVTSMSIRYMAEAPINEDIEIYMAPGDAAGRWYFKTEVGGRTNIEAIFTTEEK